MDHEEKSARIEVLLKEYDSVSQMIRALMSSNEKIMSLGLTILGAGFALGLKENIAEILLFVPVGVFGVLLYALFIYSSVMTFGGYKRCLEERINAALGENLLVWERMVRKLVHHNVTTLCLYVIYGVFLGLTIFVSLRSAHVNYGARVSLGLGIALSILFVGLVISMIRMITAFDKAYRVACAEVGHEAHSRAT